jgi:hypothetical protein
MALYMGADPASCMLPRQSKPICGHSHHQMPGLNTLRSVLSRLTLIPHWDPDQEQWDVCAIQVIENMVPATGFEPVAP